jgi:hypothetical protein
VTTDTPAKPTPATLPARAKPETAAPAKPKPAAARKRTAASKRAATKRAATSKRAADGRAAAPKAAAAPKTTPAAPKPDLNRAAVLSVLDAQERTAHAFADYQTRAAELSRIPGVTTLANAQAELLRRVTVTYLTAARDLLK